MRAHLHCCLLLVSFAAASALHAQTPIYRCTVSGTTTFSDRPCGQDASVVSVDTSRLNTFTPLPAAKVQMPKPARRKQASAEPSSDSKNRCVSIRASLHKIDAQFRAGYTAQQGIRLEERKRNLRQQARELKC